MKQPVKTIQSQQQRAPRPVPTLHVFSMDEKSLSSNAIRQHIASFKEKNVSLCFMNGDGNKQDLVSEENRQFLKNLKALATENKASYDPLLMADIFQGLAPGTTEETSGQDDLRAPNDATRELLVYAQIHQMAALYPDRQIQYHLVVDWNKPTMHPLMAFYMTYPGLLPKNVTLNLLSLDAQRLGSIEGGYGGVNEEYPKACRELFYLALMHHQQQQQKSLSSSRRGEMEIPSLCRLLDGQPKPLSDEVRTYLRALSGQVISDEEQRELQRVFDGDEYQAAVDSVSPVGLPPVPVAQDDHQVDAEIVSPLSSPRASATDSVSENKYLEGLIKNFVDEKPGADNSLFKYIRVYVCPPEVKGDDYERAINTFIRDFRALKKSMASLPAGDYEQLKGFITAMIKVVASKEFWVSTHAPLERAQIAQRRLSVEINKLEQRSLAPIQSVKSALRTFLGAIDGLLNVLTLGLYGVLLDRSKKPFLYERAHQPAFFKAEVKKALKNSSQSLPPSKGPQE